MDGHRSFQPVIEAIIQLAEHAAKEPMPARRAAGSRQDGGRQAQGRVRRQARRGLRRDPEAGAPAEGRRGQGRGQEAVRGQRGRDRRCSASSSSNLEADVVRGAILDTGKRIDGRDTKTVRQIVAEVGILPRAHGSALFTRGETQALVVATLGTGQDEQIIDALEGEYREALHDALQLPSLRGRRSAPHGLARPPRDRPRQARLARAASDAARQGQVPLHDPHRVGDHRVATARRRWPRCAAARCR